LTSKLVGPTGAAVTFVSTFVVGVLIHLPLPPSKRLATRLVTEQVSAAIRGSVEIERISKLYLGGVEAQGVTIRDPAGDTILHAPTLRVQANLLSIAWSAMPWSDSVSVRVPWVWADHIDVVFREDHAGNVTLGTAFLSPIKLPEPKPTKPSKPARPVVVDLMNIEIGSISTGGRLGGLSRVDWRARLVRGVLHAGPDGTRIDTASFPLAFHKLLTQPVQTTVDYHFRSPTLMWSSVLARYEEIALSGRVQLNGNEMLLDADLPRTEGKVLAPYLPSQVALLDPLEGKLEAHGPLPVLETHVRLTSETASVDGTGKVYLAPRFRSELDVDVRRLDLSRIVVDGPTSDLHADTRVRLNLDAENRPRIRVTGDIAPTTLYDVALPGADVDALIDADGVSGLAHVHEPGMPVRTDFTVSSSGKVRVSAVTNVPSLAAVPRLQKVVGGYAVAQLEGTYEAGRIDANVTVNAGNLAREGVRFGSATVKAHTWGTPTDLRMDTEVRGTGVNLGGATWSDLRLFLRGPIRTPQLRLNLTGDTLPDVTATAGLNLDRQISAHKVEVDLKRAGEEVKARSDLVEVRGGVVDLGALAVDGLGEPIDAVARIGARGFDVRLVSDGVDLDRFSRLMNLPGPPVKGIAQIDVDLRNVGDESRGCVQVDVSDGTVQIEMVPLSDLDLSVRASFAGSLVDVDTHVSLGGRSEGHRAPAGSAGVCLPAREVRENGVAQLRASASLTLGGPPTKLSSWRDATGTGRLVRVFVNLDRVDEMLDNPLVKAFAFVSDTKFPRVGGTIELNGEVVRDRPDAPPAWTLAASTKALSVGLDRSEDAPRIKGADLYASASMHRGGLLQSSMCVRDDMGAFDTEPCDPSETNVLASLGLLAELDYQRLYDEPGAYRQILYDARMDGRLVVHDRPADALLRPLPLREPLPVEADRASAVIGVRGTILAPHFDYHVQLSRLGPRNPGWRIPSTVCARGQYDGERAWVHTELRRYTLQGEQGLDQLCAQSPEETTSSIGFVDADLTLAWKDVLAWSSLPHIPWVANVEAFITDFELSDVPVLADNGISGRAKLAGGIKGLGAHPEFDVQLGLESLRTGPTVDYDQGNIRVHTDASGLDGTLALVDVDEDGKPSSKLTLHINTEQVRWEGGWEPTRDGSKPVDIEATAERFKVGMLTPLVQPVLSYIDGELTGKAKATWSPEDGESRIDELLFYLDNGAFQVPVIGQEFLQVKGMLQAAQSDRIFVEHFRAQSLTGAIEGRATLDLRDLDIAHVDASLWTPKNDKIRLTFEGIPVGDLYGNINVTIDPDEKQNDVKIVFDGVHVDLPTTDLRSVQQLDDNPDIAVVPSLSALSGGPSTASQTTPWVVEFETKNPAVLARSDMNFSVVTSKSERERPVLVYPDPKTGEATLHGHVLLYDGRVDVVGNFFDLEENNARVVFDGDPGNPKLNVTARWDAPDGTRVFADVTGPLRDPRIQFRSEPAMPQAEILALVLFGTQTEGAGTTTTGPTDGSGSGSAATDVGGGVASAGINMLLKDLSPVVSTRIDTSRGQSPSPTLVVQVSRDVTAEATYIAEEATLDKSDRYLLTFDWRFLRQWSLRITRGNAGTSVLDVLWQHRY